MNEHDPMCPATIADGRWRARCECDLIARVVEREQDTKFAQLDHAVVVAAKLVEVICDDEHWRSEARLEAVKHAYAERDAARADVEFWKTLSQCNADMAAGFLAARDTARAEVAALREQYVVEEFIDTDGYPSIRVIKAIERVDKNEWAMIIRREVLADLRVKVEALDESGDFLYRRAVDQVLALIEEVDRG